MKREEIIKLFQERFTRELYAEKIFPAVYSEFPVSDKKTDLLILTTGTQYEPMALSIKYHNPETILAIVTEKSDKQFRKAIEITAFNGRYEKKFLEEEVSETPKVVFEMINKLFTKGLMGIHISRDMNVVVDVTSGRKEMSGSLLLAAYLSGIKNIHYIQSEFDSNTRKAVPFSERVISLAEGAWVFRDRELKEGIKLLNRHKYSFAHEKFSSLNEKLPFKDHYLDLLISLSKHLISLVGSSAGNQYFYKNTGGFQDAYNIDGHIWKLSPVLRYLLSRKGKPDYDVLTLYYIYKAYMQLNVYEDYLFFEVSLYASLEVIKNYLLKQVGVQNSSSVPESLRKRCERKWIRIRSSIKGVRESFINKTVPSSLGVVDGIIFYLSLEENPISLDLQRVYDFSKERNTVVHHPEKFLSQKLKTQKQRERFEFVLDVFNRVFSKNLSVDDFEYVLK